MRRPALVALLLSLLAAQPAAAALSRAALGAVQATPGAGAAVPPDLVLTDLRGAPRSLRAILGGRPALLMLADFRCTQLCGSVLGIAAHALAASGLSPGRDFTLAVVGLNPEASATDGAALRTAELGAYPELQARAELLSGPPAAIKALERALGFTALRDEGAGRFAHPVDLYLLTADGRVSGLVNGLSLDPDALRLGLVAAGQGRIGSLIDRLHLLCYGLDPLAGASTRLAQTMLRIGASLTLLGAGGGLGLLAMRRRGARPVAGRGRG